MIGQLKQCEASVRNPGLFHRAAFVHHQHAIAAVRPVLLRVEFAVEVMNQPLEQRILTIPGHIDVSSVIVFRRTKPRWMTPWIMTPGQYFNKLI